MSQTVKAIRLAVDVFRIARSVQARDERWGGLLVSKQARAIALGCALGILAVGGCGDDPIRQLGGVAPGPSPTTPSLDSDLLDPASVDSDSQSIEITFHAKTAFCCNPLTVEFAVDPSSAPDVRAEAVTWDFGDGRTGRGSPVTHTYAWRGAFPVAMDIEFPDGSAETNMQTLFLLWNEGGGTDVFLSAEHNADNPPGETVGDPGMSPGLQNEDPTGDEPVLFVDVGPDQVVSAGDIVTLSGLGYLNAGPGSLVYRWSQLGDKTVQLSAAYMPSSRFVAPEVDAPTTLAFAFTVTAGTLSSTDVVHVTVEPRGVDAPEADAYGAVIEFITAPEGVHAPGPAEMKFRFLEEEGISDVYVVLGSCRTNHDFGDILVPQGTREYSTTIDIRAGTTNWYHVRYKRFGVEYASRSVSVNTLPPDQNAEPAPVIWYHLYRQPITILEDAIASGVITHVMIAGADRVAVQFDRKEVLDAIDLCRKHGVKTIWSRHLWNNPYELQSIEDTFDPTVYVEAIEQTRLEAEALGVDATAIDFEPYGASPLVDYFKGGPLPEANYDAMRAAILTATAEAGRLDYVHPIRTLDGPLWYGTLSPLTARQRIATSTYYDTPGKNCRMDNPYEVFGAFISVSTERPHDGLRPHFLPYDIVSRGYLWNAAAGAPHPRNGLFLYPGETELAIESARLLREFFAGD